MTTASPDHAAAQTGAFARHGQVLRPLTHLTEHRGQWIEITDLWGKRVLEYGYLADVMSISVDCIWIQLITDGVLNARKFALNTTRFVVVPPPVAPNLTDDALAPTELEASEDGQVNLDAAREIAQISQEVEDLKGRLDYLRERKQELENLLVEQFAAHGMTSVSVDGKTVYTQRNRHPEYLERPAAEGGGRYNARDLVAAFAALNRQAQISPPTINANTLGAVLREYADNDGALPPELADKVRLVTSMQIRVRTAAKRS